MIKMTYRHFYLIIIFTFLNILPLYSSNNYKVIKVIDGDTIECSDGNIAFRVRLAGIDSPEIKTYWGRRSKIYMEELVLNKTVILKQYSLDAFNRVVADVIYNNENINYKIISDGFAEYYRPNCLDYEQQKSKKVYDYAMDTYIKLEKEAKKKKLNIWNTKDYISPCKYRKNRK